MTNISFRTKLIGLVICVILTTIFTSYLSVNYYISNYISESDTEGIKREMEMAKESLVAQMSNRILLAQSTQFNFTEIEQTTSYWPSAGWISVPRFRNPLEC